MSALAKYYVLRDGSDPMGALDLLAEDVHYHLMPQPRVELKGTGRHRLRAALEAMPAGPRTRHRLDLQAELGGLEFVLGERLLGDESLGTSVALAAVDSEGAIQSYIGSFFEGTSVALSPKSGK